ncbi:MAG TPA: glycoside hydrolase family 32 protein [Verrucomicrobiae bacterium]|nr:glycoside hydrolase family 32 protein [Verrucomicrobiae bacterium]
MLWILGASLLTLNAADPADIIIADFEGDTYGSWETTGEAFGRGPARGTLPNQMPVSGFEGQGLVDSFYHGDKSTGTLTSPFFKIERAHINFLLGGGNHPGETCINLLVDDKVVRTSPGTDSEALEWAGWDVGDLNGKQARIQIVDKNTGGWGHICVDQITQSAKARQEEPVVRELYDEQYRPQFHFSSRKGWHNDPNGLVYYAGEYHLFFQLNPEAVVWGNMTWGHAVGPDLVHWQQLPNAIERDAMGTIFSGSAVVDANNTAGFQTGKEKVLVAMYTSAGDTSPESKGQPFTQCIAYSNDRGRTWTKYAGNPVIKQISNGNRDPRVFWHAPTKRWIVALYVEKNKVNEIQFFSSPNLKDWTYLSSFADFYECPDIFELPVDGKPVNKKWVLTGADGNYIIGQFDGTRFKKESGKHKGDWGANFYASQTYSDIPSSDGRRIQIPWMNGGKYPKMPFNQQMGFPAELTLRTFPEGIRMCRQPVKELALLHTRKHEWNNLALNPGENPLADIKGELFDIQAEIDLGEAGEVGFNLRGEPVVYSLLDRRLASLGKQAPLDPVNSRIQLQILVDRSSLEVFANHGKVSMSTCFLPKAREQGLQIYAKGGPARIRSLTVYELKSIWNVK